MSNAVWPSDLIPDSMEFYLEFNTVSMVSPFTRQERVLERAGARWTCSMQFSLVTQEEAARFDALLATLRGRVLPIEIFDFRRPEPNGPGLSAGEAASTVNTTFTDGTTFTDLTEFEPGSSGPARTISVSQTGEVIYTTNWGASQDPVLKAGDYIEFADNCLHIVLEDTASDLGGNAVLRVAPALLNEVAASTEIKTRPASGLFRLYDDMQGKNRTVAPVIGSYNIQFVEVIR